MHHKWVRKEVKKNTETVTKWLSMLQPWNNHKRCFKYPQKLHWTAINLLWVHLKISGNCMYVYIQAKTCTTSPLYSESCNFLISQELDHLIPATSLNWAHFYDWCDQVDQIFDSIKLIRSIWLDEINWIKHQVDGIKLNE